MKNIIRIVSLALLVMLVWVPLQPVSAKGPSFDGQVIFGQSYTLKQGDTQNGDLVIFGGSATLEQGSVVNGDLVLVGGTLVADGEITGDVAVTGGSVKLGATAHIRGNLATVGTSFERAEGAQIDGQITNTATSWTGNGITSNPIVPSTPETPRFNFNFNPIWEMFNAFGQATALALLAMLVMLFLAPHTERVVQAGSGQPLIAGGLGLLTLVVAPLALVLMTITLILIPVVVVAIVALFVAAIFGWIAVGYEIGRRFTTAIHQNWHPSFSAGLGVFTLTLVSAALTGIPGLNCVGWLVPFLLSLVGLGAVIMTRFGMKAVTAPVAAVPVPPAAPAAPAAPAEPALPLPPAAAAPAPVVASEPPAEVPAVPQRKPRTKKTG